MNKFSDIPEDSYSSIKQEDVPDPIKQEDVPDSIKQEDVSDSIIIDYNSITIDYNSNLLYSPAFYNDVPEANATIKLYIVNMRSLHHIITKTLVEFIYGITSMSYKLANVVESNITLEFKYKLYSSMNFNKYMILRDLVESIHINRCYYITAESLANTNIAMIFSNIIFERINDNNAFYMVKLPCTIGTVCDHVRFAFYDELYNMTINTLLSRLNLEGVFKKF